MANCIMHEMIHASPIQIDSLVRTNVLGATEVEPSCFFWSAHWLSLDIALCTAVIPDSILSLISETEHAVRKKKSVEIM